MSYNDALTVICIAILDTADYKLICILFRGLEVEEHDQ